MMPGLALSAEHEAIVRIILAQHLAPDVAVSVFGSRATGKARTYSDLDLVLHSAEPLAPALLIDLAEAFGESDLPWKVDLLDWSTTNAAFRELIARDQVPLIAASAQVRAGE
jgi:predicted nucleotidyltransferase